MAKEQEQERRSGGENKSRGRSVYVVRGILLVLFNLILYSLLLIAIVWVCRTGYRFSYQVFGEVTVAEAPGTDVSVIIQPEEDILELAGKLEQNGVVVNKYSFFVRTKLMMFDGKILRPGDYTLNTSMTYEEILDKILKSETK